MDPVFPQTAFSFSVNGLAPPGRLKRQKNGSGELHPLYSTSNKPLKGTGCIDICLMQEMSQNMVSSKQIGKAYSILISLSPIFSLCHDARL